MPYEPTYPPEFAVGDRVLLYLEDQEYHGTITRRWWDEDALDWVYNVSGLDACEIAAFEVHAL